MNSKRPTIKDVAARANVSYQTVSRVINHKGEVRPATRKRVLRVLKDLNYRPNIIARSMVAGRTFTLGCISPNLTDYTFACRIEGAQATAREHNFFLVSASASSEKEVELLCDDLVHSGRVEGLLVINPYADQRHKYYKRLIAQGIPLVYFGGSARHERVSSVNPDDESSTYQALKHLIELGHRDIAMITGPRVEDCVTDRNAGYMRALQDAGLDGDSARVMTGDWTPTSGYNCFNQLRKRRTISALFAQNDRMAFGAIRAAHEHGLHVPDDLAVVGFDDIPLAAYFEPPLTTVHQDFFAEGSEGARILIETIGNSRRPIENLVVPTELVIRESSCHKEALESQSSN